MKLTCTRLTFVILCLFALKSFGNTYYPDSFHSKINNQQIDSEVLKAELGKILGSYHQKHSGKNDTIGTCHRQFGNCYKHRYINYREARRYLFGRLHLKKDSSGYYVKDVYCQKRFYSPSKVGPNRIPDHTKLNCEHTWPQSRFTNNYPKKIQKSDLHHLYPTDSKANSTRANYKFANVVNDHLLGEDCDSSAHGSSMLDGRDAFEPPMDHKGNVARAIFYFSVRYKTPISPNEEITLKKWHLLDPVDQNEMNRNEKIYEIQKSRNPFIDYPELVEQITDF